MSSGDRAKPANPYADVASRVLEQRLKEAEAKLSGAERARAEAEMVAESSRIELREIRDQHEALTSKLGQADAARDEWQAKVIRLEEKLRLLEKESGVSYSDAAERFQHEAQLKEAQARADKLEKECARLQFELKHPARDAAAAGRRGAEEGSAELRKRLMETRDRVLGLEKAKEQAEKRAERLAEELEETRESAQKEWEGAARERSALESQVAELRAQLSTSALKEYAQRQEVLRTENAALQAMVDDIKKELQTANQRLHKWEQDAEQQDGADSKLKQDVDRLQEALDATRDQLLETEEARNELEQAYNLVQDELEQRFVRQQQAAEQSQASDAPGAASFRILLLAAGIGILIGVLGFAIAVELMTPGTLSAGSSSTQDDAAPTRAKPPENPSAVQVTPPPRRDPAKAATPPLAVPEQKAPRSVSADAASATESRQSSTPESSNKDTASSPSAARELSESLSGGGRAPTMVWIPDGRFAMGSNSDPLAPEEQPVHEVTVPGYYIARHEVTFAEYDRFARSTSRPLPDDRGWGRGSRPVVNVSWEDAVAYTKWLSKATGKKYRLPTESEWEYAARAGTDTLYWWGNFVGERNANCFDCGSEWDFKSTAPVGSFSPNPYGLFDTAGNVQEWVEDCFYPSYRDAPVDGSAWARRGCEKRVVRGGAFNKPAERIRTSRRDPMPPDTRLSMIGFRVVRER